MKVFNPVMFLLAAQQQSKTTPSNFVSVSMSQSPGPVKDRNEKVQKLLAAAANIGQVGSIASEEDRTRMETLAQALFDESDPNPARYPLEGIHNLVYSAAPGGSSGRLFGNFVGKVTQWFEDENIFYNRVELGPLMISLRAKREIKSDTVIKVSFLQTTISMFGKKLVKKDIGGWRCVEGKVCRQNQGC